MATDGGPAGAGALRLLGANRPFRLLWTARAVSFLGDSLSLVALMLHVAGTTGQALAVAALLLAGDFAPALLGPLTGTVADRLDRRRVMVACELAQGALVVVIALWLPSLPLLLVLVGLRAVAGQVFQPASRAAVPAVVPERDLERANAAVGVATNGGETLGPLVAALLLPVLDVRGVLLVDAATFGVSAALLGFLPALPQNGQGRDQRASFLADARTGLRYVWGEPTVRAVVLGYFAIVACNGIDDVALVFLATDTLGGGDRAVGLLLAAVGIGLLAGYALLARARRRVAMPALLLAGFASCPPGCSAGSSAPSTAGSASRPRSPTSSAVFSWTAPPQGRLRRRRRRRPPRHRRHRPGPTPRRPDTFSLGSHGALPATLHKAYIQGCQGAASGGGGWASVVHVRSWPERCWWP